MLPRTDIVGLPSQLLGVDRCLVMGVVNVTPDSFSDGGRWFDPATAIAHGVDLLRQGADILDVGGESTRPGAARVPVHEELRRVLPVVRGLVAEGAVVSVDTMRAEVAAAAVDAGASIINDVSAGLADHAMASLVAYSGLAYIAMHWRAQSDVMEQRAQYGDVTAEVTAELQDRVDALTAARVDPRQIVVDPGLGFSKSGDHNWTLLAELEAFASLGRPVLVGASRKRFLGSLLAGPDGEPPSPESRDNATAAITALAAAAGVWCVRVHEVRASADAVRVVARLGRA